MLEKRKWPHAKVHHFKKLEKCYRRQRTGVGRGVGVGRESERDYIYMKCHVDLLAKLKTNLKK